MLNNLNNAIEYQNLEVAELELVIREGKPEWKTSFMQRTQAFASKIIRLYCSLDKSRDEVRTIGRQLLRSGTSVAAQYREASRARSDAEFISKIESTTQEADESQLWLELLNEDCGISGNTIDFLLKEVDELISIFVTMAVNVKARKTKHHP